MHTDGNDLEEWEKRNMWEQEGQNGRRRAPGQGRGDGSQGTGLMESNQGSSRGCTDGAPGRGHSRRKGLGQSRWPSELSGVTGHRRVWKAQQARESWKGSGLNPGANAEPRRGSGRVT